MKYFTVLFFMSLGLPLASLGNSRDCDMRDNRIQNMIDLQKKLIPLGDGPVAAKDYRLPNMPDLEESDTENPTTIQSGPVKANLKGKKIQIKSQF
jgi:hypothetical protein